MANLPRKPQAGDRTLQSMYDAICNIIDYLPSLEIRGDNRTIRINSYGKGKTIEAIQYATSIPNSGGGSVEPESPIPAIVTNGNREIGYTVTLYADGYDKPSTGTRNSVFITRQSTSTVSAKWN